VKYFSDIPEGQAIVHSKGVYRQVKIAQRDGRVYARHGAGYVRLNKGGTTSCISVLWREVDAPDGMITEDGLGVYYAGPDAQVVRAAE